MKPDRVRRLVSLSVSTAQIRTAMYDEQEHMIVPVVVMKGDAVVRPLYSNGPEFVPASELALLPQSLDGRPVVSDHPLEGKSSANVPGILDKESFGLAFNSKIVGKDLHCEAYINPAKAKKVGPSAQFVIDRVNAKEMVEISCGAYVTLEKSSGVSPSGVEYEYIWRDITFDHLAIGLNGSEGACSLEMGCGAPRMNVKNNNNGNGIRQLRSTKDGDNVKGLDKLKELVNSLRQSKGDDGADVLLPVFVPSQEGMSDSDLKSKLHSALYAAVPAFDWIYDIYQEDGTVIYSTWDMERGILYWTRSFTVGSDDEITLTDDEQQVEPTTKWEPVTMATMTAAKVKVKVSKPACECQQEGVTSTMDKKAKDELVTRLVANEKVRARNLDKSKLEAMSDDGLSLLDDLTKVEEKKVEVPVPTPVTASVQITEEQLPQALRDRLAKADEIVKERETQRAAKQSQLVASLKEPAKDVYSEVQLQAMSVEQLESIEKLLKLNKPAVDYSGQGFPVQSVADANRPDAPPDMATAIRQSRGQVVATASN